MARGAFCDRVTYGILRSQQPYSSLSQATQATNSNHEISMPSHDNPKNINSAKTIRFIQTQSNTGRCRGPVQSCPCNTQHEQIWTVPGSWQPPVPQGVRRPVPCCAAAPALFTCPWDSVHCCDLLCIAVHCCALLCCCCCCRYCLDLEHELEAVWHIWRSNHRGGQEWILRSYKTRVQLGSNSVCLVGDNPNVRMLQYG